MPSTDRIGEWNLRSPTPIGEGGAGSVFDGEHRTSGQRGAVKVIARGHGPCSPPLERRLEQEVRLLQELNHPNIVRFLDSGYDPSRGFFVVMEYLGSESLHDELYRHARGGADGYPALSIEEACDIAEQLCDAVLCAEREANANHRDIKPRTVIRRGPRAVLVDWGVAFAKDYTQITIGRVAPGTELHAPPERTRRLDLTDEYDWSRWDAFSLGAMLCELLTGRLPPARPAGPMDPGEVAPRWLRDLCVDATQPDWRRRLAVSDVKRRLAAGDAEAGITTGIGGRALELRRVALKAIFGAVAVGGGFGLSLFPFHGCREDPLPAPGMSHLALSRGGGGPDR